MTRVLFVFPTAKIYPQLLENEISKVDGVREVAVCGTLDCEHDGFQIPICFIVLEDGCESEQVVANVQIHCEETFSEYARPKKILVRKNMPLTRVGKIDIRALEEEIV